MSDIEIAGDIEELIGQAAAPAKVALPAESVTMKTDAAEADEGPNDSAAGSDASQASVRPLRLSDLPDADTVAGMPPERQWRRVHAAAVARDLDAYIDPASGYQVWTRLYLKRKGPCCGNACRHCPYGHENVPKVAA